MGALSSLLLTIVGCIFGALLLLALAVGAWIWFASGRAKRRDDIPHTGVEIIEGIPGSGKTYFAVRMVLHAISFDRRPCFTNLPLKWPCMRFVLRKRGGQELVRLLFPLTKDHFVRFLLRASAWRKMRDTFNAERAALEVISEELEAKGDRGEASRVRREANTKYSAEAFRRLFAEKHGEHILRGEAANWIEFGAMIVLDEVHQWFRQEDQKKGLPELLEYLTMHRHFGHLVQVISQDRMQVDIAFRRQAEFIWRVWNRGEDRLAWGLRLKHFGIKAMGYARFTKEQEEARDKEGAKPSLEMTIYPSLPRNRWIFRLYNSFTHAGSRRQQKRAIASVREQIGLNERGETMAEQELAAEKAAERKKRRQPRWIARQLRRGVVLGCVVALAFTWGKSRGGGGAAATKAAALAAGAAPSDQKWGSMQGVGPDFVRVDGKRLKVGDRHGNARLEFVDVRGRASLWNVDGDVWLWGLRDEAPSRIGSESDVRAALEREISKRGRAFGTAVETTQGG